MLYVVGQIDEKELHNIFFVYGDLYCDSHDIYENVENVIKAGLESLDEVDPAETNELGRINPVDNDFENIDEFEEFCKENGVSISNEEIEDPQNPANLINSKLITYYY